MIAGAAVGLSSIEVVVEAVEVAVIPILILVPTVGLVVRLSTDMIKL